MQSTRARIFNSFPARKPQEQAQSGGDQTAIISPGGRARRVPIVSTAD